MWARFAKPRYPLWGISARSGKDSYYGNGEQGGGGGAPTIISWYNSGSSAGVSGGGLSASSGFGDSYGGGGSGGGSVGSASNNSKVSAQTPKPSAKRFDDKKANEKKKKQSRRDDVKKLLNNLNLKEKVLKFTSDIIAPLVETPQDIVFPIINQISVIANEGIHEGKAYNSNNVPFPNTYELNSWSLESGRNNQSTGNPSFEEGQEIINNTTSIIMLPVKAADNPATNFIIKTAIKKGLKGGMKVVE